ncbi:hypothetical protein AO398_03715 [Methylobacterium sp. GXS13]|jgi:hypothetical protein|uniref:permease n=1 Tax=unclassified Methylobacterium TaxID=2615210 RepID=UPI00071BFE69|nr:MULTISPECIES: permease [unclassified Methylobacterium]KST59995.1 hypothetical protein AO398_03715 [Methylobacterium sp. GXS13]MCJ2102315.1 permease [Methylobacterium sp. E-046]
MDAIIHGAGGGFLMAAGMFWQTGWSLVLGFTISAVLQSVVSSDQMRKAFGGGSVREIALATLAGAASSSCSYASAAIMRTLFKKGAALVTSLAFLFASTNLVLELGLILYVLLGWQFMLGEWVGGVVLIAIMSALVTLTYPRRLVEEARAHDEESRGHEHMSMTVDGPTWRARLAKPEARIRVAQNFAMEWRMLWKDLAMGFLIGGFLAALVPDGVWRTLFLSDAPAWLQVPVNVLLGPLIAVLTFVCSIGNVPLAAVLWAGGASFSGVLAFLYADLIVIPLLDIYRRYFGWRMAAYIGGVFFVTMAAAALVVDLTFTALGWIPSRDIDVRAQMTEFSLNYTFWLNLVFGALAAYLFWVSHKHPMHHGHGEQGDDGHGDQHGHDHTMHARR